MMEFYNQNFTNGILSVTQQRQALGGWVYLGCVGGVTSFSLLGLYLIYVCVHIKKNPSWTRRYQAWITSLPMAVSFLSLASYFVPRFAVTCETIKFLYMPFILMFFIEVTLIIGGGEKSILNYLVSGNVQFYLFNLPRCCKHDCCGIAVNKFRLRIAIALVYQAFISSLLLAIIMALLEDAEVLERDWKYYLLMFFIGLQKVQNFSIGILTYTNFISTVTGKTIDAGLSMCEAFIFGILLFAVFVANPDEKKKNTQPEIDRNLAAAEPENIPLTSRNESATDNYANQTCHNMMN
uniref:Uncharacterized protein n=1 Tax=Daphnia galeata TaxID=27404 RepID=A0A8J2RRP4_9CRUS|nr:unnamed protein product [Daphnia galeata]